ncbi:hypothetical protein RU98_GL003034 [Enterococcus caccae]|nr:hypothetical protein RU98_GL003034 [Enterococcus caccae]
MKQIEVPQDESRAALQIDSEQRKNKFSKIHYKWGELILSSVIIGCFVFVGTLMWPKNKETNKPSTVASTFSSTEKNQEIPASIFQSVKYWKIKNEETYYQFSENKVRMISKYFTQMEPEYTFKENQLVILTEVISDQGEVISDTYSYQVKKEGTTLLLEPNSAEVERIVLEPHNEEIFPYTEESIKKLEPAVDPDFTKYATWTAIIKGNDGQNSIVDFDEFLRKEKVEGEDRWMTTTYEVKNNHLLVNYGSYTMGSDMYRDGENIILWPTSSTLPSAEDRKEYKEEKVTILKPNK